MKAETEAVNRARKEVQIQAKPTLERLEREWYELVFKNRELLEITQSMENTLGPLPHPVSQ